MNGFAQRFWLYDLQFVAFFEDGLDEIMGGGHMVLKESALFFGGYLFLGVVQGQGAQVVVHG